MKKWMLGVPIVILLLGLAACGSPAGTQFGNTKPPTTTAAPATTSPPKIVLPTPTVIVPSPDESFSPSVPAERMVIYSGYLALVVDDITASIDQISNLAVSFGGYVVNSNVGEEQNRLYASISFRVDSARFNEALQALRDLAVDVRSESTSGQDVTEEYVDLEARLRNLEASEAQLLELMEKAGTVEEILKVQQELVQTRQEIEQIKGRMQYLQESSSLAFISVSLEQSKLVVEFTASGRTVKEGQAIQFQSIVSGGFSPYTYEWNFGDGGTSTEENPFHVYGDSGVYTVTLSVKDDKEHTATFIREDYITVSAGWQAGSTTDSAWKGLVAFGHFLANFFIWLGIFSPLWIAILLILYFAWWRKRKKKAQ